MPSNGYPSWKEKLQFFQKQFGRYLVGKMEDSSIKNNVSGDVLIQMYISHNNGHFKVELAKIFSITIDSGIQPHEK